MNKKSWVLFNIFLLVFIQLIDIQAQTIQIVSPLIGNVDKNDLQKAIDEEKKKLLLQ